MCNCVLKIVKKIFLILYCYFHNLICYQQVSNKLQILKFRYLAPHPLST